MSAVELPPGWARATLGDLVDRLQYGYTASADPKAPGPRFLRITDLRDDGINWDQVPGCIATPEDLEKYALHDGDVVFARTGSIEKAAVVRNPPESVFASYLIRGRPASPALSEWIGRFVRSREYLEQIGAAGAGIGRENVNATKLAAVRIPLPPLAEQHRIVAKLDELLASSRAARASLNEVPALLEQCRQAVLAGAYRGQLGDLRRGSLHDAENGGEWRRMPLSSVAGASGLFTDGDWVESKDQDPAGDVRLIQLADIGTGVFRDRSMRFLTRLKVEELGCTYLRKGDVLVSRMADPLGRACIFPGLDQPCVTAVDVCIVRTDREEIDPEWLMHAINSPQVRRRIDSEASGTTRKRISRSRLGAVEIEVPPLREQRIIARRVSACMEVLDSMATQASSLCQQLDHLEASVLESAFGGELVPQDAADEPASVHLERIRAERAEAPTRRARRRSARA